jgi:hypothetical protein
MFEYIGSNFNETSYLNYSASNDMKPHNEWFMIIKHLIIPCLYVWEMIVKISLQVNR